MKRVRWDAPPRSPRWIASLKTGLSKIRSNSAHALARLETMQRQYPIIHEVRGLGLHLGIELRRDGKPANEEADTVLYHSLSQGLSYKVGGGCVLTLCPPMTIERQATGSGARYRRGRHRVTGLIKSLGGSLGDYNWPSSSSTLRATRKHSSDCGTPQ